VPTNPFDDKDGRYSVLRNTEGQFSLWPFGFAVPDGWEVLQADNSREECLEFIESNWRDMRPASLIRVMDAEKQ
jgi:MbtH protein